MLATQDHSHPRQQLTSTSSTDSDTQCSEGIITSRIWLNDKRKHAVYPWRPSLPPPTGRGFERSMTRGGGAGSSLRQPIPSQEHWSFCSEVLPLEAGQAQISEHILESLLAGTPHIILGKSGSPDLNVFPWHHSIYRLSGLNHPSKRIMVRYQILGW